MLRLDAAVVQSGLAVSRQRAKNLIQNGQIMVNGTICKKPSFQVDKTDQIVLLGSDIPFVGRGGLKLAYALEQMQINLTGLVCMDVGASTGGFTDCMLQHGAAKVYAVDVGHDQLAASLRSDPCVDCREGTDIRQMTPEQLPVLPSFLSVDVSFISLTHVLPSAAALLQPMEQAVVLVKLQFEAGRKNIGKNGLVLSEKAHHRVLLQMLELFAREHMSVQLICPSPIQGGSGNIEYLVVLKKSDEPGIVSDLRQVIGLAFAQSKKEKKHEGGIVSTFTKGECSRGRT